MSAAEEKEYTMFSSGLIACMQECNGGENIIPAICIAVCPANRIKKPNLTDNQLRALKAVVKLYIDKKDKTAAQ